MVDDPARGQCCLIMSGSNMLRVTTACPAPYLTRRHPLLHIKAMFPTVSRAIPVGVTMFTLLRMQAWQ